MEYSGRKRHDYFSRGINIDLSEHARNIIIIDEISFSASEKYLMIPCITSLNAAGHGLPLRETIY